MLGVWLRLKVLLSMEELPYWLLHLAIHQHRVSLSLLVYLGLLWLKLILCSLQQRLACFIVIVIFKHSMFYYKLHCLNILTFNCSLLLYACMHKMRDGCTCATAQEHSVGHRTTWLSWFSPSIFPFQVSKSGNQVCAAGAFTQPHQPCYSLVSKLITCDLAQLTISSSNHLQCFLRFVLSVCMDICMCAQVFKGSRRGH